MTRARAERGRCLVAEIEGRLVGTVTWYGPGGGRGCDWYRRPEVAAFGQLAVSPAHQGRGIGSNLIAEVERRARQAGALELALDTAEPARHLVDYYARLGYRVVEHAQWAGKKDVPQPDHEQEADVAGQPEGAELPLCKEAT